MDKVEKKKTNKRKFSLDLTPILLTELRNNCIADNVIITCYILKNEITSGEPWMTHTNYYVPSVQEEAININIYIAFDNFDKHGNITKLYVINESIDLLFLDALGASLTATKCVTLTCLKFTYCNLQAKDLECLQNFLKDFQNIIDLSLDGNPNNQQNFGCVVDHTHIKYLSLKKCEINDHGIQLLSENMLFTSPNKIVSLNLTGNFIDDNAIIHLTKMLRQNRQLRIIILADNWITDTGCTELMNSLKKFTLIHNEIIEKRRANLNYFIEKMKLIHHYKKELIANLEKYLAEQAEKEKLQESKQKKTKSPKSTKEKKPQGKSPKGKTMLSNKTCKTRNLADEIVIDEDELNMFIEKHITKRTHPFALETTEYDGNVTCSGNTYLSYINLAYNQITRIGYKQILEVLYYQFINHHLGIGLIYISLEGNNNLDSQELNDILKLFEEKKTSLISSSKNSMLNKSISRHSTILNVT